MKFVNVQEDQSLLAFDEMSIYSCIDQIGG